MHDRGFRTDDLSTHRLSAQLAYCLDHGHEAADGAGMGMTKHAAVGVDGQRASY